MRDHRRASSSDLLEALAAVVPVMLVAASGAGLLAVAVDAFLLRLLDPRAFASYLTVFVFADLLVAVFAVAPQMAAVRALAPAVVAGSHVDVVRLTLGVRSLWSLLQRRVGLGLAALLLAAVVAAGFDVRGAGLWLLVFAVFALHGRLHLEGALLAGLIRPLAALAVVRIVPAAVALALVLALAMSLPGVSPALAFGVRLCGLIAGLMAARGAIAVYGPAAGVTARTVSAAQPVPWEAFWTWTAASLAERSVGVAPLLAVLVLVDDPLAAAAYAMAWRASSIVDAGMAAHAVVRPAVAAAPPGSGDRNAGVRSAPARAVASVLWWTLFVGVLMAGPLAAGDAVLALFFGLPLYPFRSYLRWFLVARLGIVAAGPGAEVLEVGGQHAARCRVALGIALPAVALTVVLAGLDRVGAVAFVALAARLAIEVVQSWLAWSKLGVDCTVLGVLRARSGD